jgi:hypothetical protein
MAGPIDVTPDPEAYDKRDADGIVFAYGRAMRRVEITPELAKEMLATYNPGSEPDAGKVARYAELMRAGEWRLLPLPVIYRGGRLTSSRDRLAAVIEAGMTVPMYVCDDSCPR